MMSTSLLVSIELLGMAQEIWLEICKISSKVDLSTIWPGLMENKL